MAYKPGQSGNPKGRPKGSKNKNRSGKRTFSIFSVRTSNFEQLVKQSQMRILTWCMQVFDGTEGNILDMASIIARGKQMLAEEGISE